MSGKRAMVGPHSRERRPKKLAVSGCTRACSLNQVNMTREQALMLHGWLEEDLTLDEIVANAGSIGITLSTAATSRHRSKHLIEVTASEGKQLKAVSELDLLNLMIASGAEQAQRGEFKMTAEQTLRAIELKLKLTQGSLFDAMYEAMKGTPVDLDADFDAEEDGQSDPPAERSAEESAQGATDDS